MKRMPVLPKQKLNKYNKATKHYKILLLIIVSHLTS